MIYFCYFGKPKFILLLIVAFSFFCNSAFAQVVVSPAFGASMDDELLFTFDATAGNGALNGYDGEVYAYTGVITNMSNGQWTHVVNGYWGNCPDKVKMTRMASNTYTIKIVPSTFYELLPGETITQFCFLFYNSDQSKVARAQGDTDIFVPYNFVSENSSLGKVESFEQDGNVVTIHSENGDLRLTSYSEDIVKVETFPGGKMESPRASISVYALPQLDAALTVSESTDVLQLVSGDFSLSVSKENTLISYFSQDKLLTSEASNLDNASAMKNCAFTVSEGEAFYGGGERGKTLNHSGETLSMYNYQNGGYSKDGANRMNICIPFYVSSQGYGVLFDDYQDASLQFGSTVQYNSNSTTPISYYFINGGGSLENVVENYVWLTGYQELPPLWTLGFIQSKYGYRNEEEARYAVNSLKNSGYPLDGLVLDLYWYGVESNMGRYAWDATKWNSEAMLGDFSKMGVYTVCISQPYFQTNGAKENFEYAASQGYLAKDASGNAYRVPMGWLGGDCGLIDTSNPEALDWLWSLYKPLTAGGISGWWLDLGEPENHPNEVIHQAGTAREVHNAFGLWWLERVYKGLKQDFPDMRPFLMPRFGNAGMQRYSAFPWSGDVSRSWSGLQAQIPVLLNMGLSGVGYMGNDLGGFSASDMNEQLYIRWMEFGAFVPVMRAHSTNSPEPYNYSHQDILKKYINMRYQMLPYNYSLAYEYTVAGTPLARPVNFYSPREASLVDVQDEYLWGRDMLVAPVMQENATSRSIVFPEGRWVDFNNPSAVYEGMSRVDYPAPLEVLPLFVREGAILPAWEQDSYENTGEYDGSELYVRYFVPQEPLASEFVQFDDDKKSTSSLADGKYVKLNYAADSSDAGISFSVTPEGAGYDGMKDRTMIVEFVNFPAARFNGQVELNGSALVSVGSFAELKQAETDACYIDKTASRLYVKLTHNNRTADRIDVSLQSSLISNTLQPQGVSLSCMADGTVIYGLSENVEAVGLNVFRADGSLYGVKQGLPVTAGTYSGGQLLANAKGVFLLSLDIMSESGVHKVVKKVVR